MKRSNLKYFIAATLVAAGVTAVSVYSCEKESVLPGDQEVLKYETQVTPMLPDKSPELCGEVVKKSMLINSGREVGTAYIYNNTKKLYVVLISNKGFYMGDVFMNISEKYDELPLRADKSPDYDRFTVIQKGRTLSNVRILSYDVKNLNPGSFISVMADLRMQVHGSTFQTRREKVWVDGKFFGQGEQGRVFTYNKGICFTTNEVALPSAEE